MNVNIQSLQVGKKYKNLQALSLEVLGETLPKGRGRQLRIERMKQYFTWKKIENSQAIVITKIYSVRRQPLGKNLKYAPLIYDILSSCKSELSFNNYELLRELGIVNDKFDAKQIVANINALNMNYKLYKSIHAEIYSILTNIVSRSLNQLEEKGYIKVSSDYDIEYISPPDAIVSTEEIDNIYADIRKELQCNNYYEVIETGQLQTYYSLCRTKLSKLGIKRTYKKTNIKLLIKSRNRPHKNTLQSLCKELLNNRYKNNPEAVKLINLYMS